MKYIFGLFCMGLLVGAGPRAQQNMEITFDQIFPLGVQEKLGLDKLNSTEKEELRNHVESLLVVAIQVGYANAMEETGSKKARDDQDPVIESQIDGDFEGWTGETIVKLVNGQIWQQIDYYYHYHYSYMPDVLVYKSRSGWKMKVEDIDEAVQVERLK